MIDLINNEIANFIDSIESVDEDSLNKIRNRYASSITEDLKNGHYTSNVCMVLASNLKLNPKELSTTLVEKLNNLNIFEKVESAGPGFINITLKREDFLSTIKNINSVGEKYGRSLIGEGKKVQIEFVSANPTGPLHVGHGRGAAYGDAIARILTATGSEVEKEYYINDAGRQIDILTVSVIMKMAKFEGSFFPSNAYKGQYIEDIGSYIEKNEKVKFNIDESIFKGLPTDPEKEIDSLIEIIKQKYPSEWNLIKSCSLKNILEDINQDLKNFNVDFDVWFKESSLGDLSDDKSQLTKSINKLQEGGKTYEKDGAIWLNTEVSGDDKHRVLIRDNGKATYFATDVAYHKNKVDRGFDKLINVWGADHHGYIKRIEASIEALGSNKDKLDVRLVQFANLFKDGAKVKMSTRSGDFYSLGDLIKEIGSDAARFFYLSKQSDQHLDFDIDLAKSDNKENIFYYIQYAHARIFSLEEKYYESNKTKDANKFDLDNSYTKCDKLIHEISKYPQVVEKSAKTLQPHLIIFYLKDLAQLFHSYYNDNHVLTEDPKNQQLIISSLSAVKQVIANGLNLIGISPMQKM